MAEHQVVSFKQQVTTATHATSCRTLTLRVSGPRAEHWRNLMKLARAAPLHAIVRHLASLFSC